MHDLISRQAVLKLISTMPPEEAMTKALLFQSVTQMNSPSAQPDIIQCKDCLHWVRTCGDNHWGLGDCDVFDKHLVMCEGYCAWAERREE